MRTRLHATLLSVTLLIAPLAVLVVAAADRGEMTGKVTDEAGLALPGVRVSIEGPDLRTTVTDERGEFVFHFLLPGAYVARFELAGFRIESSRVTVTAGQTQRVAVSLGVGTLAETVTVMAVPGTVSTSISGTAANGLRSAERFSGRFHTEAYDHLDENPFRRVNTAPLSTFSIDVDTASYANVRRFITDGALPPPGAVRIEELINYFRFDYPQPSADAPFSATLELSPCPWNPTHALALIGLQGRDMSEQAVPPARNLVFLVDVSGSMDEPDKLPLVQQALRLLVDRLTPQDRVAIIVYAGASGVALPSTSGGEKDTIRQAVTDLKPGGSTNGAAGIVRAYAIAREHFVRGGVNRVILATDGDFNVGVTSRDALIRLIEEQRASGVYLSVLGVGTGNLKDSTMEQLADKGNGNYAYLDSLAEARKVLVREAGSTLVTIASDVKVQVEFNPRTVSAYRLIGYENRLLRDEDFKDDKKDAGEIGAGHSVTALYELVLAAGAAGVPEPTAIADVDPPKYQARVERRAAASDDVATVKVRYKAPGAARSTEMTMALRGQPRPLTPNLGFASAVAELGMLLRGSTHAGRASYDSLIARARTFRGNDRDGDRAGFVSLAERAAQLSRAGKGSPASAADTQR